MNLTILGFMAHWEILIIVLVIVLLFGGRKIPQLMKGLGQGMKEFRNATKGKQDETEIDSKKEENADNKDVNKK